MKRSILILGAGIYQVPLIRTAQRMGLRTVVASVEGDYPGIALADAFYAIDTRNFEALLDVANKEHVAGVCTSGTDVAVRSVGYICEHRELAGITQAAAELVTDKAKMKEALARAGVATAAFRKVCSLEETKQAAAQIGYPLVTKAVDSSGSRGIVKVESEADLARAFAQSFAVSKQDYILIEQFIDAPEVGVDGYVGKNGIEAFFPHKKFTYRAGDTTVPVGHAFPYDASPALLAELRAQFDKAVCALGLKNCPFNADVFVRDNEVFIIEIGGRTGATCIPELITLYTGYNWYEKIIQSALGIAPDFTATTQRPCMAKMIFSPVDDTIVSVDQARLEALRDQGLAYQLDFAPGHRVEALKDGTGRIGHLIAPGSDEQNFDKQLARFRSCIKLSSGNLEVLWEQAGLSC